MNNWILCKDKLPEVGEGEKWVTIKGHDVIKCQEGETIWEAMERVSSMRWVTRGSYSHDEKTWIDYSYGFPLMVQPVAWMDIEIPEPYEGEIED